MSTKVNEDKIVTNYSEGAMGQCPHCSEWFDVGEQFMYAQDLASDIAHFACPHCEREITVTEHREYWYELSATSPASDDSADKPQEAESGREADQLLIEAESAKPELKRCGVGCQFWKPFDESWEIGWCSRLKQNTIDGEGCEF